MSNFWFPGARRSLVFSGAGPMAYGPPKGVLHTTEGTSVAGALATYARTRSYPHLTVGDVIEQHCPVNVAATALQNLSGGVETNRGGAIQIEIVGRASNVSNLPSKTIANLISVMQWLQTVHNIRPHAPVFKAYIPGAPPGGTSYGATNGVRFTQTQWKAFDGWCGHMHVPENLHGDPGAIDIQWLLGQITDKPTSPTITKGTTIEMDITPYHVAVSQLDNDGNGWVILDVPVEKVVSMIKWGPAPLRDDGYEDSGWPDFELKLNNTDGKSLISIESDVPNGHVSFTVWVVA